MRHMTTLSYIDTVAKAGSIRAAAEQLSITASALNRRILAIEDELGVDLFERHANGVILNSAGELFVHHIRTQMADLERVRSRIADLQGNRRGHVRIAASRALAQAFLPDHIALYRDEFPNVTFELRSCDREDAERALLEMEVDVLVSLDPVERADFHSLAIASQDVMAMIPVSDPLSQQAQVGVLDCLQAPLLLPPRGDAMRERLESVLARKGLACAPAMISEDPAVLQALVAQGAGIGFATPASRPTDDPRVRTVPLRAGDVPPLLLAVGQRRGRALPVAAGKFVEQLRRALEQV